MTGNKESTLPTCFVIMPISMPAEHRGRYSDDDRHFLNVFDHLFAPALDAAGYRPIPPVSEGSELIHADIIGHLESADLVLCDMSTLNANVFFELGIRTSLDKPVCLVRDSLTPRIPFDTSTMNCYSYEALPVWDPSTQIASLNAHIQASAAKSGGQNALWKYFGLTQRGKPSEVANPTEEKLDLLLSLLRDRQADDSRTMTLEDLLREDGLDSATYSLGRRATGDPRDSSDHDRRRSDMIKYLQAEFPGISLRVNKDSKVWVRSSGLDALAQLRIKTLASAMGVPLTIVGEA